MASPEDADRSAADSDLTAEIARWKQGAAVEGSLAWRRRFVEHFLELGEPLVAYDAAAEALVRWPADLRLRQLRGLCLSRSGAVEAAAEAFRGLAAEGHGDEETLGNLARTAKSLWLADRTGPAADARRRAAQQAYAEAFRRTGGHWTAINAATLALAGGDRAGATHFAREALGRAAPELARCSAEDPQRYWLLATCGEAALLLGRAEQALEYYRAAGAAAGRRYANLASTRSQLRLLAELLNLDAAPLEACFRLPRVVVGAGHMIDPALRRDRRFPPAAAAAVRREIDARLAAWGAAWGFSSAACGADLLFLEALAERGDEATIVLPLPVEQFVAESVAFAENGAWVARFEAALRRLGPPILAARTATPASGAAFDYANRLLCGLAKLQADALDVPVTLLAVWDGDAAGPRGGTADLVRRWQAQGLPLEAIPLAPLRQAASAGITPAERTAAAAQPPPAANDGDPELRALLFADVRGFSRLSDVQMAPFVRHFLGAIGDLPEATGIAPLSVNTWGDGYFAVFSSVVEAGEFALAMAERLRDAPWDDYGLPADLNIRIALHAGPVFELADPITGRAGYWGDHVSRAARIEPVTPPGQVYASQAFAALARDDPQQRFACEYVGRTPLAKDYGAFPTYHVARRSAERCRKEP